MRLHRNWGQLLFQTYSARLAWVLTLINGFEASYSWFLGYAPMPDWALGVTNLVLPPAILLARIAVQKKFEAASTEGGDAL